jgi:predicted dehydrogenase
MSSSRRVFLGAVTAASYKRLLGANDRIQVGFIGYGLIGRQHVHDFKNQKDADLAAMCEVCQPRLEEGLAACGPGAKPYQDFRKLLDDKDIQAIVVCTPDHWHALLTIMACAAGKDVYVEKPLTVFVKEGRWMTEAARRYQRIVQVGTQQRSGPHYQKARELVQAGYFGKVLSARMGSYRNVMPGFGNPPDGPPPRDLDYDMWLGPAPKRPYNPHRALYHFRWFWDYSGGQMTNWGAHHLDIARWIVDEIAPANVSGAGGRFALTDGGETPDVQQVTYRFSKSVVTWTTSEIGEGDPLTLNIYGTKGMMTLLRSGFHIKPETTTKPGSKEKIPLMDAMDVKGDDLNVPHVRNFLDCVKSRNKPNADVEEGHRTAVMCHLGNISTRLGRTLAWDAAHERITGDSEANQWLMKPYRAPWKLA